jgi:hypothetical protein
MRGGRALLAKISKGSKGKKLVALDLCKNPVCGHYRRHLPKSKWWFIDM